MIKVKGRTVAAGAALAVLTLSGCVPAQTTPSADASAGGLPPAIAQSGTLKVGTSPAYAPMAFKNPDNANETIGADIDLANAVAKQLGVKVELVETPFDQLINSVATGRVDTVMSGISDTVERQKSATFVDYLNSQGRFYALTDKAGGYTGEDTICGKTVAVSSKTDYYDQVADVSKKVCESAGKPAIERLSTDSGAAARLQIEQGRADLAVQGGEGIAYLDKFTEKGKYKVVLDPLPGTPFGAIVMKDDMQLANALLKAFQDIQANGEYDKILTKWGLEEYKLAPVINGTK
ncbi:ABC transporter substrate-binding protein [Micropruina sp.]|uniref:ABC transporter substrate-binding protein n=1 Tax=Micropruina sp. TaxID=2737536 RepID=UPI002603EC1E|nr:ABC transporter substrate-binding protein [Micropruina sp.]